MEEPLKAEEKNKSADISKQKEQCLVPCDVQAKILRGEKQYMCSMYSYRILSTTSCAMLCYAFLCYAMLCCANLFFNLLEHMWQTLTELPTVQIWDAVCSWDNEVNHATFSL